MKVTGVEVTPYANQSAGELPHGGCLIELLTDAGLTGIGITAAEGASAAIEGLVKDMLVGEDPRGVTGLWRRMEELQTTRGRDGLFNEAIAILDVALWDLKAKANGEPLWKTLGGQRPKANVHASGIDPALMARDRGLRGGKMQIGGELSRDLQRLERLRTELQKTTPEPVLIVDADQKWSPEDAIRKLRELEEQFDLAWVEGATHRWDAPGLKRVSDAIRGAVCVGGGLPTLGDFLPHFQHRSADVIQLDIGAVGITGALQLADAAYGFELPVTLSASPGNIHAHLSGVMPYFMSMEVVDLVPATPIFSTDVRIEHGWGIAGDAPGHGLVVNREALAAATTRATN
jgi:L-alanine-DL-glutamate epimerase-like enolase superfamily enzyme